MRMARRTAPPSGRRTGGSQGAVDAKAAADRIDRDREATRLKQAFDPLIVESCRELIALPEDKRRAIEVDLDRRIDAQDTMARRRCHSVLDPRATARAILGSRSSSRMPELGVIDRKAAPASPGTAPHPSQSAGAFPAGATPSPGVDPGVRAAFYMAALVRNACSQIQRQGGPISTCAPPEGRPRSPSSPSRGASSPSPARPVSATTFPSITHASLDELNTVAST